MVDVNIDNNPTVVAVHWNVDLKTAKETFKNWGFNNITNFSKESILNGNAARTEAIAIAKKQNIKYYFNGSYDFGATEDSAIYKFEYSSYTGDLIDGDNDTIKYAANWSGHK